MDMPEDLKALADFHGHLCPGLAIGYRAVHAALERLGVQRSRDEELVCLVENDSCSVDAAQFLAGCTFGKGNLFFRDHGKQVFAFARRGETGEAVRVSLKPLEWGEDVPADPAAARQAKLEEFLSMPEDRMFWVDRVTLELPPEAVIRPSLPCDSCGEPVMSTRLVERDGRRLCIPCSEGWNPPHR
jgi:formylmethanofuran dehydrogenase subunit E